MTATSGRLATHLAVGTIKEIWFVQFPDRCPHVDQLTGVLCFCVACLFDVVLDHLCLIILLLLLVFIVANHITVVVVGQHITDCIETICQRVIMSSCTCCIKRCILVASLSNFLISALILCLFLTLTSSSMTFARCSFNMRNMMS
jgi:hypothetical protein